MESSKELIEIVSVAVTLLSASGFIVTLFIKRLIGSFDTLNKTVSELNINLTKNDKDTEKLKEDIKLQSLRLNNHSKTLKEHSIKIEQITTVCSMKGNLKIK